MTWEECIVRFLLSWSALDVQSTTAQASGPALSSSSSSPPSLRERFRLLIWCVSSYQESIVLQVILNLLRQEGVDRSHGMNYYCANGWHIRYFAFNSVLYVVEALCVSAHVEYDGLFPFRPRSMWCLVFLWNGTYLVALHHIALHGMTFGVMSRTYGCDCTGTTSFIDAASYLVGYEGRSSCAFICISVWFKGWMRWNILRYIMNSYISYCTTTYRTLDKLYVAVWIFGYWFDVVASKLRWEVILFPSEVSYGMAKGIVEILYAFPSLH